MPGGSARAAREGFLLGRLGLASQAHAVVVARELGHFSMERGGEIGRERGKGVSEIRGWRERERVRGEWGVIKEGETKNAGAGFLK